MKQKLTGREKKIKKDIDAGHYKTAPLSAKEKREYQEAAARALHEAPRRQAFYDIRKALGMTQESMATALQVSKRTVQSWEIGARNIPEPMLVLAELLRDVPAVRRRLLAA